MATFNKCFLLGNLVRDVELKFLPSGTAIGTFTLAVNEKTKVGEEWKDEVSYFDIVTFGKAAEACASYLGKGSPVLLSGRLRQRRWEKDGAKRSKIEIVAEYVQFLGKRKEEGAAQEAPADEDIPF